MKIHNFSISMTDRAALLVKPPAGHLGVIVSADAPDLELHSYFRITCHGAEEAVGYVVAIEPPGSCIRPDVRNFAHGKWKLHWIPVMAFRDGTVCPTCLGNTNAYVKRYVKDLDRVERWRKCMKCGERYVTAKSENEPERVLRILPKQKRKSRKK